MNTKEAIIELMEDRKQELATAPKFPLLHRNGEKITIQEMPDWFYSHGGIDFRDDAGNIYRKDWRSPAVLICEPSGEPYHRIGYIDVTALWEELEDVPMNPETEELEFSWNRFPAGTHREEIWHWFESEFGVVVADLVNSHKLTFPFAKHENDWSYPEAESSLTAEQEAQMQADFTAEMQRLEPELYQV